MCKTGKTIGIKQLALEVQKEATSKGYTSIEPDEKKLRVDTSNTGIQSIDFTLRKGNKYAGKVSVIIQNSNVNDQTVEQLSDIVVD